MAEVAGTRSVRVAFLPEWEPEGPGAARRGFFAADPRVRTLLRVLLSYPEVRYIVPDRISMEAAAGSSLIETIAQFLGRQVWFVKQVLPG